jgi:hypothetical protein
MEVTAVMLLVTLLAEAGVAAVVQVLQQQELVAMEAILLVVAAEVGQDTQLTQALAVTGVTVMFVSLRSSKVNYA